MHVLQNYFASFPQPHLRNKLFSRISFDFKNSLFLKNSLFFKNSRLGCIGIVIVDVELENSLFLKNRLFLKNSLFLEYCLFLESSLFLEYSLFLEFVFKPTVGKFAKA